MTGWELLGAILRLTGGLSIVPGLFLVANGVRVVVSGRLDERRSSQRALKIGLALVIVGVVLLFGGSLLSSGMR